MFSIQGVVVHRCNCCNQIPRPPQKTKAPETKRQECILDGLKWETLKCAGLLLCELFRSNPKYQDTVRVFRSGKLMSRAKDVRTESTSSEA